MIATATKLITAEEFAQMPEPPDGSKEELVRGEIITMPPPRHLHGVCQSNVGFLLGAYGKKSKRGRATVESGVITERDPDSVRGPDAAFWSFERLPANEWPEVYPDVAPDVCVEVLSSDERRVRMGVNLEEYFNMGVRMVWIIDPNDKTVEVYRSVDDSVILHESDTLVSEDVLPGFSCKVSEFFE